MATTPTIHFHPGRDTNARVGVLVDLRTLLETRLLVQGSSGSGKTHALYALLQETYGAVQHVIFDKEGEFPKLRERFDYLLVGPGGEVSIDPSTVVIVLQKVLETRVNAIFDMSELAPQPQREIVAQAFTYLAHLSIKSPLSDGDRLVLLDEAQHFAREGGGGESASREPVIELAALGRKRGFALVCATTRVSHLSKGVTEILDNKLIGRSGQQDARRAATELDFGKTELRELRSMRTGTFYAYGPAIAVDPVLVQTASDLAVRPRKRGEKRVTAETPAAVRDVLGSFADVPEVAAAEAHSVEELQTQVDDLTARLRKAERAVAVQVVPTVDHVATQRAVEQARRDWTRELRHRAERDLSAVGKAIDRVKAATEQLGIAFLALDGTLRPGDSLAIQPVQPLQPMTAAPSTRPVPAPEIVTYDSVQTDGESIGRTPQRMLNALRFLESIGVTPAPRDVLGGLVGVNPDTGTFRNYVSKLRTPGYVIDRDDKRIELTDAGRRLASDEGLPRTRRELHEIWLAKLGSTPRRMLELLLAAYPDAMARTALGAMCGVDPGTGTFRNYLSKLRSPGLIDDVSSGVDGEVRAAAMLFPKGLR